MPGSYPFRRLPIYSLAALALVVLAVVGGIYLVRAQAAASARVTHTIEVQVALTEVLEKVRAVESAVRGYANTHRPEMIEDLALSARDLSRDLGQVRLLTATKDACVGRTGHAALDANGRPVRLPARVREVFA